MTDAREINEAQAKLWNGPAGRAWVEGQAVLDAMLKPFEDMIAATVPAGTEGRVLDIGCGPGTTTFAAARRLGPAGSCTGIDISEPMIAAARACADREDTPVSFLRADAQTCAFEPGSWDRIISRFGVMFFDDPVAAFANLRRAASSEASLHFIAWRGPEENPFMTTAERAAAPLLPNLPVRQPDAPGQFAFADGARVRHILADSGWTEIDIKPVDAVCVMPEAELDGYLTGRGPVGQALQGADPQLRADVIGTVRAAFEPYVQGPEVRFTAACWMASARAS